MEQTGRVSARRVDNPLAQRAQVGPLTGESAEFHRTMPGFAPTPVREAPTVAAHLGVGRVLVKEETERLGLPSFKILGASWAVACTLARRWGLESPSFAELVSAARQEPDVVLVAPTDGNHGRAVARMARLLGLSAVVLVPRGTVTDRKNGIAAEGAEVIETEFGYDETVAVAAALGDTKHVVISDTSWEGYSEIPALVVDGYSTMLGEVLDELTSERIPEPTVVAAQMGVGAFAAAVARAFASRPARLLLGVEPVGADCVTVSLERGHIVTLPGDQTSIMAGLNCGTPSPIAWPDVSHAFTEMAVVPDSAAEQAIRLLHADGIDAGESGAAGLAGLLAIRDQLRPDDIVLTFVTEGPTDRDNFTRIIGE